MISNLFPLTFKYYNWKKNNQKQYLNNHFNQTIKLSQ